MNTSRFEKARVLVAEPNTALRDALVSMLEAEGFGTILQTGNMAGVREALKTGGIDVVIADTVMPEGDLSDMVWQLRHNRIGDNPFTLVIALITERTPAVVGKAVNAGVDDVLLKPIEPAQVVERVIGLIRGRKRFVVTADYIGPDRRTRARADGEEVKLIRVPNPLEMRTSGNMARAEMQRVIDQAYANINIQKVERQVHQLNWLSLRLTPHIEGVEILDTRTYRAHLKRLRDVASDLAMRIRTTDLSHLSALCMTLERVSRECAQDPDSDDKGRWNLLIRLLDSLPRACDPARGGVAPRVQQETAATGVSPLLDKQSTTGFGPGGRQIRTV